jgi:hypothetical protein
MEEKSFINDAIESFEKRRKDEFVIDYFTKPIALKNEKGEQTIIKYLSTMIKTKSLEVFPFTLTLNDVEIEYNRNQQKIFLDLVYKEYKQFFIAIRQMANGFKIFHRCKINEGITNLLPEIKGSFYTELKGGIRRLTLRVISNKDIGQTNIYSLTGEKLYPKHPQLSGISGKKVKVSTIRLRFFLYQKGGTLFFNIRVISFNLNESIKNEKVDVGKISFETFKTLKMDERIPYYVLNYTKYDDNLNNEKYFWIGIYKDDKVVAVNSNKIEEYVENNEKFDINTYLIKGKILHKKRCDNYIDDLGFHHYFLTLSFLGNHSKLVNLSRDEQQLKCYNFVHNYLEERIIDCLGIWYDESIPPDSFIHFNIHCRSILKQHYFNVLLEDWRNIYGKVLLSSCYDPLLLRMYCSRNHRIYLNPSFKYRQWKQQKTKGVDLLNNYRFSHSKDDLLDFLNEDMIGLNDEPEHEFFDIGNLIYFENVKNDDSDNDPQ